MTEHCPQTDSVLAHFLDGVADGQVDDLALHLRECAACQQVLARGRRLDAQLATCSESDVDDAVADRLFARLEHEIANNDGNERAPSLLRRVVVGSSLVAAGFLGALVIRPVPPANPPAPEHDTASQVAHPRPPSPATDDLLTDWLRESAILMPEIPAVQRLESRRSERRTPPGIIAPVPVAQLEWWASPASAATRVHLLGVLDALLGHATAADCIAEQMRVGAALRLASRSDPAAQGALTQWLAREPGGAALDLVIADETVRAQQGPWLRGQLQHRGDTPTMQAAAVLGDPALDRLLRRATRREPEAVDLVAGAIGRPTVRRDRVALLLNLWADLQSRSLPQRDADMLRAERWFANLPAAATGELLVALRSHHAEQRQRCLLALAARRDARARASLVELTGSPRREEAELAAYALARCHPESDLAATRAELQRHRRPEVLLAALASARVDLVQPWIAELDLTREEREFLRAGDFRLDQFAIAAALFRQRGSPTF